jgi:hypothetical protein
MADSLPAALAARDAARFATLRLRAGPYDLGDGGDLHVNGEVFTLTGGSRTATQVATELAAAASFAASVEAESSVSRLVLTADDAPAADAPSAIVIGEASTLEVVQGLGLKRDQREVELACSDPEPVLSPGQPEGIVRLNGAPLIFCEDAIAAEHFGGGPKSRIFKALLRLQVWVPASSSYCSWWADTAASSSLLSSRPRTRARSPVSTTGWGIASPCSAKKLSSSSRVGDCRCDSTGAHRDVSLL